MGRPLHLCEVLEEEHAALYPRDQWEKTWTVEPGQVRDAKAIADACEEAFPNDAFRPETIVEDLNRLIEADKVLRPGYHLSERLEELLDQAEEEPHGAELQHLNRLVLDEVAGTALVNGEEARLSRYFEAVHKRGDTSALCISGGGIRSATFALGVLQGLARRNVLDKFDFISTVSGGGYIGSWLSSWARRHPDGARGVAEELSRLPADALSPEPPPVRHLREYSNYLTPKLGLTSGDTWALAATYVRNLLLNWTILVPLLLAVLAIPRLVTALFFSDPFRDLAARVPMFAPLANVAAPWTGWIFFFTGFGSFLIGLAYLGVRRPAGNRYRRTGAGGDDAEFRRWCLIPLTLGALFVAAAWVRYANAYPDDYPNRWSALLMIGGPVTVWLVNTIRYALTDPAHRREDIAAQVRGQRPYMKKFSWELVAAIIGGTLSHFLLMGFAELFPDPSRTLTLSTFPSPVNAVPELMPESALYVCFAVPLLMATLFVSAAVFVGVSGNVNEDYDREWWARCSGWVLTAILAWPLVAATVIFGPVLIWFAPKIIAAAGGIGTVAAVLLGRSSKTGGEKGDKKEAKSDLGARLAAPAIILFLFASLSLLTTSILTKIEGIQPLAPVRIVSGEKVTWAINGGVYTSWDAENAAGWEHLRAIYVSSAPLLLAGMGIAWIITLLAARVINVNKFSMHSMYRNRLIRAYLGASRAERDPNPFTGFDPQDNFSYHLLRPELLWATSFRDFPGFVAKLRTAPKDSFADNLRDEIEDRKKNLLDGHLDPEACKESLFQVLNCILEEVNLKNFTESGRPRHRSLYQRIVDTSPKGKGRSLFQRITGSYQDVTRADPRRLAANRRILDEAFRTELYPFEAPLLHRGDVADPATFAAAFEHGLGEKLAARFTDPKLVEKLAQRSEYGYATTVVRVLAEVNRLLATIRFDDLVKGKDPRPLDAAFGMVENRKVLEEHFGSPDVDMAIVEAKGTTVPIRPALHKLRAPRPLHVVNAALNLVSGQNLAWQERKAESFTFSPLHCGSFHLGYRPSVDYGGPTGVSLGTAVTISGAAASPQMGYHSSAPLSLLMTFFNVRLGWWLGNPGAHGADTYHEWGPRNALRPLVAEALGDTDDSFPYVYLSDGGHFENLALYEMVLRRRRYIVVSDAGCDEAFSFEDLGNAIRKIRTDFGIPIEMDEPMALFARSSKEVGKYCAVGRIRYSAVDEGVADGVLLYLKPAVYMRDEPKDVYNYASSCQSFPHESTADQFFSESQFESYRALGNHVIDDLCTALDDDHAPNWTAASLAQFFGVAEKYLDPRDLPALPDEPRKKGRRRRRAVEATG